ncbi:ribonuclease H-like domain-containing protein [Gymnopilus junonius]|uniref:Ribonuclease H-like domain-containing protein n=1 Tax=Gymnopilus junonius TaxID=109634 RepID=A0A9P5NAD5_GYMJU|nr:ribonuclease H-like domain-containing protein [Gymnopilus junonius]
MSPAIRLVDSTSILEECLADISSPDITQLAIDLEGVDLCRHGRIAILQIFANASNTIWLVDITTLGKSAFDHKDGEERCLKDVLQSSNTTKIFYDVRNDADALFNLFAIDISNAYDLQLLEVAVRRSSKLRVKFLSGLGKAIEVYLNPPADWKYIKEKGITLFQPNKGGSYDIFEKRPLDPTILAYCAQDVALLFKLKAALEGELGLQGSMWKEKIVRLSAARVAEAHSHYYAGNGKHRAIAPMF